MPGCLGCGPGQEKPRTEPYCPRPAERRSQAGATVNAARNNAPGIGNSLHFCPSRGRTMERKGTTVMKRYLTALLGATLVLLSFAGTRARADFIAAWSYDWSRTPSTGVI